MGGCCSSSRKLQLHGAPMYYYYPPIAVNLDMSTPDTYRPPPTPIPYDVVMGCPIVLGSVATSMEKHRCMNLKEANCKSELTFLPPSPRKVEVGVLKPNRFSVSASDEEDVCPTCLEDYDSENPKIMTKCKHHFHLSCILDWMERSDTCPICDQEMVYESP